MSTLPTHVKGTVIVHHTDAYIPDGGEPGEPIASLAPQPPHTLYNQRSYRLQQSGVTRNGEQAWSYTIVLPDGWKPQGSFVQTLHCDSYVNRDTAGGTSTTHYLGLSIDPIAEPYSPPDADDTTASFVRTDYEGFAKYAAPEGVPLQIEARYTLSCTATVYHQDDPDTLYTVTDTVPVTFVCDIAVTPVTLTITPSTLAFTGDVDNMAGGGTVTDSLTATLSDGSVDTFDWTMQVDTYTSYKGDTQGSDAAGGLILQDAGNKRVTANKTGSYQLKGARSPLKFIVTAANKYTYDRLTMTGSLTASTTAAGGKSATIPFTVDAQLTSQPSCEWMLPDDTYSLATVANGATNSTPENMLDIKAAPGEQSIVYLLTVDSWTGDSTSSLAILVDGQTSTPLSAAGSTSLTHTTTVGAGASAAAIVNLSFVAGSPTAEQQYSIQGSLKATLPGGQSNTYTFTLTATVPAAAQPEPPVLAAPVDGAEITCNVMGDGSWSECSWQDAEGNNKYNLGIPAGVTMTSVDLTAPLTCSKEGATAELRVTLDGGIDVKTEGGLYSYDVTGTYSATYHFSNGTSVSDSGTVDIRRTND